MLVHRMVTKVKDSKVWDLLQTKVKDNRDKLVERYKGVDIFFDHTNNYFWAIPKGGVGITGTPLSVMHSKIDEFRNDQNTMDDSDTVVSVAEVKGMSRAEINNYIHLTQEALKEDGWSLEAIRELFKRAGQMMKGQDSDIPSRDPRGYKVTDQIIKGFMIYKSGKPSIFTAKNENGEQYEGRLEEITKKIDEYWNKRDAEVVSQKKLGIGYKGFDSKTRDWSRSEEAYEEGEEAAAKGKSLTANPYQNVSRSGYGDLKMSWDDGWRQWHMAHDSKTSDKAFHPRWRIKDDKVFKLRSVAKDIKKKMKDVDLNNRAVWSKADFDKMVATGNFTIVSKQPWGYEVKVKSGNIYGVEIKDTYTKGSAGEDKEPDKSWKPQYGIGKDGAGEDAWVKFKNYAFSKGYKNKEVGDLSFTNSKGKIIKLKSAIGGKLKVYEEGVGVYEVNDTADPDFLKGAGEDKEPDKSWKPKYGIGKDADYSRRDKIEREMDSLQAALRDENFRKNSPDAYKEMKQRYEQLKREIKTGEVNDTDPDMLRMYEQKLEDAIDSGDKEEMKRWSRELLAEVMGTRDEEKANYVVYYMERGEDRNLVKQVIESGLTKEKAEQVARRWKIVNHKDTKIETKDADSNNYDVRNIEEETTTNDNFRKVVFTGNNLQLVLMSLLPNEDIGMEVHDKVDQFFRIDSGSGELEIEGEGKTAIKDGTSIVIKAGTHHNIIAGDDGLKLYTVYAPPNHPPDRIQATKEIAMKEEKA